MNLSVNSPDLSHYLADSLHLLRRSLELYLSGDIPFYRVIAVQLRLLLTDTTRRHDRPFDLALLPRVYPDLALPPLAPTGDFDLSAPPLPLADWLDQRVEPGLTLRNLIRAVCDQDGGAHVDRRRTLPLPADRANRLASIAALLVDQLP